MPGMCRDTDYLPGHPITGGADAARIVIYLD